MTQSQLLQFAIETLERLGIQYALVGSLASSTLGEARFTNDIDIVVRLDVFDASRLCDAFAGDDFALYKPAVLQEVERGGQFNILHPSSSNKIDFMVVGSTDWSRRQLKRRERRQVLDVAECYVAAPEDIILGKLLYYQVGGSEKHLRDIAGIWKRSGERIDREYLEAGVTELGLSDAWSVMLERLNQ